MRFEWDGNKAESNFLKHGITFEEAVTGIGYQTVINEVLLERIS
ncbi:MAG: hypothetical protein V7K97_30640 [Nostoc sp.]